MGAKAHRLQTGLRVLSSTRPRQRVAYIQSTHMPYKHSACLPFFVRCQRPPDNPSNFSDQLPVILGGDRCIGRKMVAKQPDLAGRPSL